MRHNAMKAELAAGGGTAGTSRRSAAPALGEVAALAGCGHVLSDAEHGHISVADF